MIRPDRLVFGYVVFKIDINDISFAADRLLARSISAKIKGDGTFIISLRDRERTENALSGKVAYTVSEVRGLVGSLLKLRRRYGLICALLLSIFTFIFLSGKVWDVRIESDDAELVESVKEELSQNGLYVGADWRKIDKSKVEAGVLSSSSEVSWINVNRRGSVAYISIIKKEYFPPPEPISGYANVIAERDCVIEDIEVKRGIAVVKIGDTVKRGDLLISGIIPTELGGGFCFAEGEVRGRYSDSVSVAVESVEREKVYTSVSTRKISVSFFDFSINIFKRYGNLPLMCDIIEEKSVFSSSGGKALPISVQRTEAKEYFYREIRLTKKEMSSRARTLLRERLNSYLADKDLLSVATVSGETDNGYTLRADMVLRGSVTKITKFEFDSEK